MEEDDILSSIGDGIPVNGKVLGSFQHNFVQVQHILDQNRLLINEINQNHESRIPDNLTRNVILIRELNNNIRRVATLYSALSSSFARSVETLPQGSGRQAQKRVRSSS